MGIEEWVGSVKREHATALVVSLWLITMLFLALLYYKKQRRGMADSRGSLVQPHGPIAEVIEPQMGHPITLGVTGWQTAHTEDKVLPEEIVEMLWGTGNGVKLEEPEQEAPTPEDDNVWGNEIGEETVPRTIPLAPSSPRQ